MYESEKKKGRRERYFRFLILERDPPIILRSDDDNLLDLRFGGVKNPIPSNRWTISQAF